VLRAVVVNNRNDKALRAEGKVVLDMVGGRDFRAKAARWDLPQNNWGEAVVLTSISRGRRSLAHAHADCVDHNGRTRNNNLCQRRVQVRGRGDGECRKEWVDC
jgi:hypothetical protein